MPTKRKHDKFKDSDSDSDSEYSDDLTEIVENNDFEQWLNKIKDTMRERKIKYEDIRKLNLSEEDNIWFIEHLSILDNLYENTEEYYNMKMLIYNKYNDYYKNKPLIDKLGKNTDITTDVVKRIIESNHPDTIKTELYRRYSFIDNTHKNEEYYKTMEWIDTILNIPTELKISDSTNINNSLEKLKKSLDDTIYGLENVKEKIMETYCAMMTNINYKKKFIAFVGPPGVGKTALGNTIANAFELPYSQISFGGIKDSSTLIGQSTGYIGSRPGIFTSKLRQMKYLNGVILLDEIDKIPDSQEGHTINSVLLHILDKTQNHTFQDMFIPEIPINLSNILFILALNDIDKLDPILRDRLYVVEIPGYKMEDKIKIGTNYIFPKIRDSLLFKPNEINMDYHVMRNMILKYDNGELGVRNLERLITTICERLNILKNIGDNKKIKLSYTINNLKFPLNITDKIVNILLE